jgi:biopolymer transport protein ExbB
MAYERGAGMIELVARGGWILVILAGISVVALMLFLERLFHLRRAHINSSDFLDGIYNVLRRRNVVEAVSLCEDTPGPVAHITKAAILQGDRAPEEIERVIEQAGLAEIPRLERNLSLLANLAYLAPLLGLLGTVLGLMEALLVMQQSGPLVAAGDLAGGLWEALLTTAAGLTVAIPAYAGYHFLLHRLERILLDMERASVDLLQFFGQPAAAVEVDEE